MIDTRRRIEAAQRLAEQTDNEGERNAALAAVQRMQASQSTRNAVAIKAAVNRAPRAVAALLPHQRMAFLCLAAGGGRLSKKENSFLHKMRDSRWISPRQQAWLTDLDARLRWEAGLVPAR